MQKVLCPKGLSVQKKAPIWEDFFDRIQYYGCLYCELAWEQPIQLLYKIMFNFNNLIY